MLFLHGYGGSRYSYSQKYPVLRQIFQNHTWIVAAVDCRDNDWYIEPSRQDITDVLNKLRDDFYIDPSHIHIMGNSMGGAGALKYAMFNNAVIASVVDINGITNFTQFYIETPTYKASLVAAYGGTPYQVPAIYANESPLGNEYRFIHTPVMIMHGSADDVVNVSQSRYLNQSLSALGYAVKYVEVPGVAHDAALLMSGRENEIFDWFNNHPLWQEPLQMSLIVQAFGNGVTNNTGTTLYYQYDSASVLATPDSGYVLDYWLLNGTNVGSANPYTINMTANYNLAAVFTPVPPLQYSLTMYTVGQGSVTPGNGTYTSGTVVDIKAFNVAGWAFQGWSGDASGSSNTTVTMNGPVTVTATFTQNQYSLTMYTVGQGTVSPGNGTYLSGTNVDIKAFNAAGWTFQGWSGDASGSANTTVTMSSNKVVTAAFTQNSPPSSGVFGNTVVGGSVGTWAPNDKGGCRFTLSEDGVVTSISFYINSYTATCNVKIGIYANDGSGGAAGTLKGQTGSYTVTATGWHTWSGLNITLPAGTYYFYWVSSNAMTTRYSGGGDGEYATGTTYANELLANCQTMTNDPGMEAKVSTRITHVQLLLPSNMREIRLRSRSMEVAVLCILM